jgi:hypothetical protein
MLLSVIMVTDTHIRGSHTIDCEGGRGAGVEVLLHLFLILAFMEVRGTLYPSPFT